MSTRIYLVRHGESESNLIHQFAGSLNRPLTERGRAQANATAAFLSNVPFSCVYSSDLYRAFDTGSAIANQQQIPIYPDIRLREIFAGDWEGKTYDQLDADFADSYSVWRHQIGLAQCPNGESVAQLQSRVSQCINEIVHNHKDQTVCIATHATPIRTLECLLAGKPLKEMHTIPWVSNASVSIVEYDDNNIGRFIERDIHDHLGNLHTKLAKNV